MSWRWSGQRVESGGGDSLVSRTGFGQRAGELESSGGDGVSNGVGTAGPIRILT